MHNAYTFFTSCDVQYKVHTYVIIIINSWSSSPSPFLVALLFVIANGNMNYFLKTYFNLYNIYYSFLCTHTQHMFHRTQMFTLFVPFNHFSLFIFFVEQTHTLLFVINSSSNNGSGALLLSLSMFYSGQCFVGMLRQENEMNACKYKIRTT